MVRASGSTSNFTSSTQDLSTSKSDDESYYIWFICYLMKLQIICKIDKHNLRSCGEETVVLKYLSLKVVDYDGM